MKALFKNIIRSILHFWFSIFKPKDGVSSIQILKNYIYSIKLSKLFYCHNVSFKRKVNWIVGAKYFKIGKGTCFGKLAVLTAWDEYEGEKFKPNVKIGENCNFGDYLHLTCINKIHIGNNVLTGRWVTISDNGHGEVTYENLKIPPVKRKLACKGPVIIGNNVWIGDKASILSGVTIGKGSVIGANTVVTKDIPPFSVAVGNPAKVIKTIKLL